MFEDVAMIHEGRGRAGGTLEADDDLDLTRHESGADRAP